MHHAERRIARAPPSLALLLSCTLVVVPLAADTLGTALVGTGHEFTNLAADTLSAALAGTGEALRASSTSRDVSRIVRRERDRSDASSGAVQASTHLAVREGFEKIGASGAGSDVVSDAVEGRAKSASASLAQDTDTSFFLREKDNVHTLEGWGDVVNALQDHKSRVFDEKLARFVILPLPDLNPSKLANLPPRSKDRPYLAFGYDRPPDPNKDAAMLKSRGNHDILFVGYDLRPFGKNDDRLMWGITFAPPLFFGCPPGFDVRVTRCRPKEPYDPAKPPRFLLTFRGDRKPGLFYTSSVRPDIDKAFKNFKAPNVHVQMVQDAINPLLYDFYFQNDPLRYTELYDSAYVLVPRGHGRWTYRFSEAMGACSIPVVMADGLTLPYEEMIDWSRAIIRLPESLAKEGAQAIIDKLPKDPTKIKEMRAEVCRLNDLFFNSMEKRSDAMLHAAVIKVAQTPPELSG